ncbi:hypothetical protein [Pseudomonas sp. LRF_L74]|uniref:hypothetical protein n=1 Tax=Pseudomonas sp. LRF_L74 TaxID=3369422 RepID=UPI003F642EC0
MNLDNPPIWDGEVPAVPGARIVTVPHLPDTLDGAVPVGPHSQARPGALLRIVPGVGRFLASDGMRIEVAPQEGADPAEVETYLHGGVRGALIHQRGELPLHASTVIAPNGLAVAIAGESGAGKSTLATELALQGWSLLADDLTRVTWNGKYAMAWPGQASPKLMSDACHRLGISLDGVRRVGGDPEKFQVEFPACAAPVPLGMIVLLRRHGGQPRTILQGIPAFAAAAEQIFRPNYLKALGQSGNTFKVLTNALSRCRVLLAGRGESAMSLAADCPDILS